MARTRSGCSAVSAPIASNHDRSGLAAGAGGVHRVNERPGVVRAELRRCRALLMGTRAQCDSPTRQLVVRRVTAGFTDDSAWLWNIRYCLASSGPPPTIGKVDRTSRPASCVVERPHAKHLHRNTIGAQSTAMGFTSSDREKCMNLSSLPHVLPGRLHSRSRESRVPLEELDAMLLDTVGAARRSCSAIEVLLEIFVAYLGPRQHPPHDPESGRHPFTRRSTSPRAIEPCQA